MADTKLTRTKIPNMKGRPKKLGLLTTKKRRNMTFRVRYDMVEALDDLTAVLKANISNKISRTDVLEALTIWASRQSIEKLHDIILVLGKDK